MVGWNSGWAYHGDDGKRLCGKRKGSPYGPIFCTGDRVGCGIFADGTVFFTLNGHFLGPFPNEEPRVNLQARVFSTVSVCGFDAHIKFHFDPASFVFSPTSSFEPVSFFRSLPRTFCNLNFLRDAFGSNNRKILDLLGTVDCDLSAILLNALVVGNPNLATEMKLHSLRYASSLIQLATRDIYGDLALKPPNKSARLGNETSILNLKAVDKPENGGLEGRPDPYMRSNSSSSMLNRPIGMSSALGNIPAAMNSTRFSTHPTLQNSANRSPRENSNFEVNVVSNISNLSNFANSSSDQQGQGQISPKQFVPSSPFSQHPFSSSPFTHSSPFLQPSSPTFSQPSASPSSPSFNNVGLGSPNSSNNMSSAFGAQYSNSWGMSDSPRLSFSPAINHNINNNNNNQNNNTNNNHNYGNNNQGNNNQGNGNNNSNNFNNNQNYHVNTSPGSLPANNHNQNQNYNNGHNSASMDHIYAMENYLKMTMGNMSMSRSSLTLTLHVMMAGSDIDDLRELVLTNDQLTMKGMTAALCELFDDIYPEGRAILKIMKEVNNSTLVKLVADKNIQALKQHDKIFVHFA